MSGLTSLYKNKKMDSVFGFFSEPEIMHYSDASESIPIYFRPKSYFSLIPLPQIFETGLIPNTLDSETEKE